MVKIIKYFIASTKKQLIYFSDEAQGVVMIFFFNLVIRFRTMIRRNELNKAVKLLVNESRNLLDTYREL